MKSTLYKNIVSNATGTAIGSLIQLALIFLLARFLSVHEFAVYLTSVSIVGVGEIGSDFGTRVWATKQFAIVEHPHASLSSSLASKLFFSISLGIVLFLYSPSLLSFPQLLLVLFIAIMQPSTDPFLWYLRGVERLDVEAVVVLGWRFFNAMAIAILAFAGFGVTALLSVWVTANLLRMLLEWRLPMLRPLRRDKTSSILSGNFAVNGMRLIRTVIPIGLAFFLMALYQRVGVLLLGEVADAHAVAIYGAAFTLVASAGFVGTSITVSSFPQLARAIEGQDWKSAEATASRKLRLIMAFFFPACIVGGLIAPLVIRLLYPASYSGAVGIVLALLPGLYISTVNFALKYLLNALALNWIDALSAGVGIITFAAVVVIPGWHLIAEAAGWAWGAGEAVIFIIKWMALLRDGRMRLPVGRHLLLFLLLVGVFLLMREGHVSSLA